MLRFSGLPTFFESVRMPFEEIVWYYRLVLALGSSFSSRSVNLSITSDNAQQIYASDFLSLASDRHNKQSTL